MGHLARGCTFFSTFTCYVALYARICRIFFVVLSYLKETFNNKFFAKGGKQSPKSPKTPNNESKNIRDDDKETEKDSKGKNLSKHQLKSARKAERVSEEYKNSYDT